MPGRFPPPPVPRRYSGLRQALPLTFFRYPPRKAQSMPIKRDKNGRFASSGGSGSGKSGRSTTSGGKTRVVGTIGRESMVMRKKDTSPPKTREQQVADAKQLAARREQYFAERRKKRNR